MIDEPRFEGDYTKRQVKAAHRVLVDVGQVLGSFHDAMVIVGGWVPDLLLRDTVPEHMGSIDVDLALDAPLKKNHPKLVEGFRVLQFPACTSGLQPCPTWSS